MPRHTGLSNFVIDHGRNTAGTSIQTDGKAIPLPVSGLRLMPEY